MKEACWSRELNQWLLDVTASVLPIYHMTFWCLDFDQIIEVVYTYLETVRGMTEMYGNKAIWTNVHYRFKSLNSWPFSINNHTISHRWTETIQLSACFVTMKHRGREKLVFFDTFQLMEIVSEILLTVGLVPTWALGRLNLLFM